MPDQRNFDIRCGTCGRETDGWCPDCAEQSLYERLNNPAYCRQCGSPDLEPDVTADGEEYDKCSVCGTVED